MDAVSQNVQFFLGVGCQKWHSRKFISANYKNVLVKLMLFPPCFELTIVQLSIWCFPPPLLPKDLRVRTSVFACGVGSGPPRVENSRADSSFVVPLSCQGLGLGLWARPAQRGCCGVFWMWMWSSLSVLCFARILALKNKAVAMK